MPKGIYKHKPNQLFQKGNKKSLGEANGRWKGDKIKYSALHMWVRKWKPKSMFCEKCGKITEKLVVANKTGKYLRDIDDFRWLCHKCNRNDGIKMTNKIKPVKRHCGCGRRTKHHHNLCDKCWNLKQKIKNKQ
jgi:hypothetical protein